MLYIIINAFTYYYYLTTYFDNQNALNAPHVNETVCYHWVLDIEAVQHRRKLRMMDSTDKNT